MNKRQKKIEVVYLKPSEIRLDFGNPRKINTRDKDSLKRSLEKFGNHDIIKIDNNLSCISGSQRIEALIALENDTPVLCKKLIGYSKKELRIINIKSNEHSGSWDYDKAEEWKDDLLNEDLNFTFEEKIKTKEKNINPYNNIYIFLMIPVNKIHLCKKELDAIKKKDFIEYDQSQN